MPISFPNATIMGIGASISISALILLGATAGLLLLIIIRAIA